MEPSSIPDDFLMPDGHPDYICLIKNSRVYDVVKETPLTYATRLSRRLQCNVWLKREDAQPIFSFKLRGAYNKMAHLSDIERSRGVIACSAGNHGQGVAYAARELGISATIVMPLSTPYIKSTNIAQLGGKVLLHGHDFDEAKAKCAQLAALHGFTNIPPFDDPFVIAGQGTIGMEIANQQIEPSKLDAIFCAVGGGGLIAGIGTYIKHIMPHVKIIGVVADGSDAMLQSLALGRRVKLSEVNKFADGVAVKEVGKETFRLCSGVVDQMVKVDKKDICQAIRDVYEETRVVLEPAGALALAGLKVYARATSTETNSTRGLVAVASGANMDFDVLKYVAENAAAHSVDERSLTIPNSWPAMSRVERICLSHKT